MSQITFDDIPYEIMELILIKTIKINNNDNQMCGRYNKHNLIVFSLTIMYKYSLLSKKIKDICNNIINNYDLQNFNPCSMCLRNKVQVFYNGNKGNGECRFCWDYR